MAARKKAAPRKRVRKGKSILVDVTARKIAVRLPESADEHAARVGDLGDVGDVGELGTNAPPS